MIDDQVSGDQICLQCRHILGKILFPSFTPVETRQETSLNVREIMVREFIMDVCEILQVNTSFLVDSAFNILKNMEIDRENGLSFSISGRAKVAFAIWEALNRQGTPYHPYVIAERCAVPAHYILDIEKKYLKDYPITDTSAYVERICDLMAIPFKITRVLQEIVITLQDRYQGRHPETLIGAVIVKCIVRSPEHALLNVTEKSVSKCLGVKIKTIRKLVNELPNYRLFYDMKENRISFLEMKY